MNRKLININDSKKFKDQNIKEWHLNSDFWLEGNMRHINDVKGKTIEIILYLLNQRKKNSAEKKTLIDIGCGDGWLYRAIRDAKIDLIYYGIDFNEFFINTLKERYKTDANAVFSTIDIEENEIKDMEEKVDVAINAFNFFEIPDLEKAMMNTYKLIKNDGYLLILTIDSITQLLSISEDEKMFYDYLEEYAEKRNKIGYKKRIDIRNKKTRKNYYGILYSLENYLAEGKKCNLVLQDYFEIINPARHTPQLYQFILFKKVK